MTHQKSIFWCPILEWVLKPRTAPSKQVVECLSLCSFSPGPQWYPCQETLPKAKATQDVFAVAVAETDKLDIVLEKFSHWKVMRICAWIMQLIRNARSAKMRRLTGPLTSSYTWWKCFLSFQYLPLPHSASELRLHRTKSRAALGQTTAYQYWRTWFVCLLTALLFLSSTQSLQSTGGFQGIRPKQNHQEELIC